MTTKKNLRISRFKIWQKNQRQLSWLYSEQKQKKNLNRNTRQADVELSILYVSASALRACVQGACACVMWTDFTFALCELSYRSLTAKIEAFVHEML